MFTCKPYEVDADMPIFPASEDEPVVLEHFLVEPPCKEDWVSGLLDLDAFQIEKSFNIEDISSTFDYDQIKLDTDAVHTMLPKGEEKSLEFPSEASQGINFGGSEENHFDTKHADKAVKSDDGSCNKSSCLGNVGLENQSQSVHKTGSDEEMVKLSSTSMPVLNYTYNHHPSLLDQAAAKELDEAFKNISGHETLLIDKNWPNKNNLYGLENYAQLETSLNLMKFEEISTESEDKTIFLSIVDYCASSTIPVTGPLNSESISGQQQMKRKRVDGCESIKTSTSDVSKIEFCSDEGYRAEPLVSPKRSRKPPRRYIEESLEYESKSNNKKCGIGKRSKDRILYDRYPKYKWQNAEHMVYEDDSFNGGCIQVPFGLPMEREQPHPKKNKSSLGSGVSKENRLLDPSERFDVALIVESQEDISEDECVARSFTAKGSTRRKRHISWTTEEVVKLVDGVSQCGVGRWTEIKRLLFSSASHRTSVDLKDKWRNLLRASCTQLQIKEKFTYPSKLMQVDQGRKQATNFVPESILWRVRELAVIYPYPRDSRSKVSCIIPAVSSFPASTSNALVPLSTAV
ncbi:Telomere repeat-binding protein 4 [Morus notabilis]|uniref:Telomere repeat-binding protein 4 n=1 Tax=Morus notabilis TaxID=981085 RepID=W9SRL6_9ROSA|nr:Telomere repeat-binding protein 4 [Morus notabilis]